MEESFKRSTVKMSRVIFELSGWNLYPDSSDNDTDIITTTQHQGRRLIAYQNLSVSESFINLSKKGQFAHSEYTKPLSRLNTAL